MEIQLNGTGRTVPEGSTIAVLIESLGYAGKRVAVERNGEIVPRSAYGDACLAAGDVVEIVVAVGGG